jgi:DNA-binding transcriptional LysR family regulator
VDLRQLEAFLAVARHLHFGRAAEELYLSQPAVSQAVHRLERELGGELFDRTSRRVELSAVGRAFLPGATEAYAAIVGAYERGRRLAALDDHRLVVGYGAGAGTELVALIPEVQRRFPDLMIEPRAMTTVDQLRALAAHEIDAALCWMPHLDDRFDHAEIGSSRLVAMVRHDHPLASADEATMADVVDEPLIAWGRGVNPSLYDCFASAMDATGRPWALVGTATGAVEVAARVASGFGVGVLFAAVAEAQPIAGVRCIPLIDAPVIEKVLVWRRDDRSEVLAGFVTALRQAAVGRAAASDRSARPSAR